MEKLIEAGADVTAVDNQGNSALSIALLALPIGFPNHAGNRNSPMSNIANALLRACSKIGAIPHYVVHRAANVGRTDLIELLVKYFGSDVADQASQNGMTPLHYAVQAHQLQVGSFACSVRTIAPATCLTLRFAISRTRKATRLLLHHGAMVDSRLASTVRVKIQTFKHKCDHLARFSAFVSFLFLQGATPLMMLCQREGPDSLLIAEELLKNGADPNKKVPLHLVAVVGCFVFLIVTTLIFGAY